MKYFYVPSVEKRKEKIYTHFFPHRNSRPWKWNENILTTRILTMWMTYPKKMEKNVWCDFPVGSTSKMYILFTSKTFCSNILTSFFNKMRCTRFFEQISIIYNFIVLNLCHNIMFVFDFIHRYELCCYYLLNIQFYTISKKKKK